MVVSLPQRRALGFGTPMTQPELEAWADKVVGSVPGRLPRLRAREALEQVHARARRRGLRRGACSALCSLPAFAWGDEGHEVIGLIADHYLEPAVRRRVQALLAGDESGLTARDIAHEATWADKYRDSDRDSARVRYAQTRSWHFVDLELAGADIRRACFGQPELAPGVRGFRGPRARTA